MKQIIKDLIAEFWSRNLPKPFSREIALPNLPPEVRRAWVLMGMRRSGKTWTMYHEMQKLLRHGLPKEKILYLNFEDERLAGFLASDFQFILDAYFDLYPNYSNDPTVVFCFDEIHLIEGWEKFIRRLIDHDTMQVWVTGSSAKMLSSELATSLPGRAWPQEVFPFNFREYLHFHQVELKEHLAPKEQSLVRHWGNNYLTYGGFPETLFASKELHSEILQGYMDVVILRDIIERHQVKNAHVVKIFLRHLMRQLAAPLSITTLYNHLKSQGLALGKNSLYEYFSYFQEAYALFSVPIFSFSEKMALANPKKLYAADPGMITAHSIKKKYERRECLENAVYNHLRSKYKDIFYHRTKSRKEVDFVALLPSGEYKLYQVSLNIIDERTRERELIALVEGLKEFDQSIGWIITEDHEESIKLEHVEIHIIPFWKWALREVP